MPPAGDPFPAGSDLPPSSEADVARWFGAEFAAAVFQQPHRQWSGPLRSFYGSHLVWIEERTEAVSAPAVAAPSSSAATAECGARAVRLALAEMRNNYEVSRADDEPR
jgi:hypothetical protein